MGRVIKAAELTRKRRGITGESERAATELVATWAAIHELRAGARDQIVDLALTIARRVIGRAVELDPGVLDGIYRQALGAAREMGAGIIRVHPADRESSGIDRMAGELGFEIKEDPEVGRAGCRVIAGDVEVDATLDTVLGALGAAMKGNGRE